MGVHHPGAQVEIGDLLATVRRMVVATLQNASIGSAGLRVYDGGWITITNGGLSVTGSALVSGLLDGTGTLDWTGPWFLRGSGQIPGNVTMNGFLTQVGGASLVGPVSVVGTLDVTGAAQFSNTLRIAGATTLESILSVTSGSINAGNMFINGNSGGTVGSSGTLNLVGAVVNLAGLLTQAGFFKATTIETASLDVTGTKNFKIPHPTKPDHFLRHGSTESPVSGVEYWGDEILPATGELTVTLPDYFESLTKPEGRTILVTGRGFVADWTDITDGGFTVTGTPGKRFSWLVKAERAGADFVLEEPVYGPLREDTP